ncbi:hypothetical protein CK503_00035 [Aliifodinibius salipaludis]|uniref:DUF952 domain-containing protein n=1 Tax=Fodinibius salipaludis TaxID=2032627 RepID=A0A2A2GE54_9BACT|nr:DUF952 domain-containing protein [Aliifodinibius salipaludis]PAU95490.1 hypothetical protein CK503_00035 [Aliifodinibius salipaludis]
MRDDLLFHITTKEDWKTFNNSGSFEPESLDSEGFIHCSTGEQVEDTANRIFGDKDEILLLVIDATTLHEDIKYEKDADTGEKFPHLYSPLNTNAIIDKITIKAEDDGHFDIAFTTS